MEIQGIIQQILEPQTFNGRNGEFKKFGFILETQEQYPKKIHMQVFGEDKWNSMGIQQGQNVCAFFDLSSREWNGKWFTSCDCWKVTMPQMQPQPQQVQQPQNVAQPQPQVAPQQSKDDLPF